LPMVAGTSEAPSGILRDDRVNLPSDYFQRLFVTSWGDHTIEAFSLSPRGASFSATSKIVVRGDENFRPVAIATAPHGSVVFNDWVDKSYPVHGKGRIWRLRGSAPTKYRPTVKYPRPGDPESRMAEILKLRSPETLKDIIPALADPDPFLVSAALEVLGKA